MISKTACLWRVIRKENPMNKPILALKKLCCMALAVVLLVCAPASAFAAKAIVTSSSMKVYSAKNVVAGKLSRGTIVTVKSYSDGIAKISYKGKTGYAFLSSMDALKSTEVAVSGARVYKSASTGSASASIGKGTNVNVISTTGSWAKIERSGNIGYVKKNVLELYYDPDDAKTTSTSSTVTTSTSGASKADTVISAAKSKLGCEYVYGRSGPSAFDCAGLVSYAYRQVGISLSRSAYGQGYGKGDKVTYSELEPGDIVCFNTNESDGDEVDHTGIYLGSGRFVHASSAGGKVIISSMSSGYYKRVFSWGRRVL